MKNSLQQKRRNICLILAMLSSFLMYQTRAFAAAKPQFTNDSTAVATPEEKKLSELLEWVEATYDINLSYDMDMVRGKMLKVEENSFPSGKKVKIKDVETTLKRVLAPLGLNMKRIDKNYYLIQKRKNEIGPDRIEGKSPNMENDHMGKGQNTIARVSRRSLLAGNSGLGSDRVISGNVTDESGNSLPGVNVYVKNTTVGTVSDSNGDYKLSIPDDSEILVFSYIGYQTEEIEIGSRSVIDMSLVPDIATLQDIVVVGYGTQQKRDLTGSIVSVKGEDLVNIPVPRIEEQLKAKVPGLQISTTGNHPGGTIQIRLRGNNSIEGDNSPLIVIDGMIGGDLFYINPSDIESVEVLKDASATAIYGARGANGVIILTTKKGSGEAKVNFDAYYGWQRVAKTIDVLNAEQFTEIYNQTNADPLDPSTIDTDWQDEIYQVAPIQNYQLSVSGGNDQTSYLFSTSFFDQEGVIPNSDFRRMTVRINLDQKLSKRITIGNNLSFGRTLNNLVRMNQSLGTLGNPVSTMALITPPVIPVRDPVTGDFSANTFNPSRENPIRLIEQRDDLRTNNYLIGNFYGDIELFKGLNYRLNVGYILRDFLRQRYDGRELIAAEGGRSEITASKRNQLLVENTLTYQNTFADNHNLTVLGGFTTQENNRDDSFIRGIGFSSDDLGFDAIELAETIGPITTGAERERIVSFLGRVNYSFASKYLFTASFRADGASVFAENNKWGYFPSASVGWNISEEAFMSDVRPVSNLKLRVSYGQTGSPNIRPFQSLASFDSGKDYAFGEDVFFNGLLPARVANADLKWETTTTFNVGLELGLFDQRVELTAEYYDKETKDLHYDKELPDYTGFTDQTQNVGSMSNRGLELALNTINLDRTIKWSSNFNIFFNRNEVLEIGDDFQDELIINSGNTTSSAIREATILKEGEPLGAFFGFIFDGIYQNQAEVDAIDDPGAAPGQVRFVDRDGDGDIDQDDRGVIGNPQPDFVWGFTNNLSYKNFDLNFTLQGVQGADVFWTNKYHLLRSNGDDNLLPEVLNPWTEEGSSNSMQALDQEPGEMSTRYIEDGSYIRLQNVALGYTFPQAVLDKVHMSRLRFYVSAQNLFLITDYPGYDPEVNSRGGVGTVSNENLLLGYDHGSYPGVRTFTIGLNATF